MTSKLDAGVACAVLAFGVAHAASAAEGTAAVPLPEMVVARTSAPPTIDGTLSPGEWDRAAACTGFTVAFHGNLSEVQSAAWMTYDERFIYVAMKNHRGEKTTLLRKRARKPDDGDIVFDPSNEIWLTPPSSPRATYQTLFSSYPGVFDAKKIPSVGYTAMSWTGRWEIAASETTEYWITEAKAPLTSFGVDAIRDGDTWQALFATDMGDRYGFRAWAPGGAFEEINRHGYVHFRERGPIFQLLDIESVFTGKADLAMAVGAPAESRANVLVTVRLGGGVVPADGDRVITRDLAVGAGEVQQFAVFADLTGMDLPLRTVTITKKPRETRDVPGGYCEVTAETARGQVLYHQVFPFVICEELVRRPPREIERSPYETPIGVQAFHAPLNRKLLVKVDRFYLPRREEAVGGVARLVDPETGEVVAERPLAPFYYDYSELAMDLGDVEVPVQTEADWAAAQPVVEENKRRASENEERARRGEAVLPLQDVPGPRPAEYRLDVVVSSRAGDPIASVRTRVTLMGYEFEWLPNDVGISEKVIPPWTPMAWRKGRLSMWNKTYRLNGLGLARSIVNGGARQLSGPMKLVASMDGKEVEVRSGRPKVKRLTEAAVLLQGSARLGGLEIRTDARVEFDGFVLNTMALAPRRPTRIERLSLVVQMPRAEAPCFVTTAGGWAAYHGWTPERWDSRETALGSMIYKFVPYVFLTDSERGFCCFVDSVQGFALDPEAPVQELCTEGDTVILRLHFITEPTVLEKPTTVRYGWMVTPQKPQPPGWRGYHIAHSKPYPEATCVFWCDADWAVLWPYYSSPFPWDYEKSRAELQRRKDNGIIPCVGNIAHAIARYQDYKGRRFPELAADWGMIPGNLANGNVARGRGPNDFQLWHWDQWVKRSGLVGLYFDETYLSDDANCLTGGALLLEDEQLQPGYNYLGLREMSKRLRYMFHANGVPPPNIWFHTTSGHPVYAWMPDVGMEGENVAPTGYDNDYLDCLPASRLRAICMGANLGIAPTIMCQAQRHWEADLSPFMVHQFVGWILAHDCLPEQVGFWDVLAGELGLWRDDVRFLPYWKRGLAVESCVEGVLASAHARPGHAVVWAVNTSAEDKRARIELDLAGLGLDADGLLVFDAETGDRHGVRAGALTVDVPERMWRAIRLKAPRLLAEDETFIARFDGDRVAADECLGSPYGSVAGKRGGGSPLAPGKSGGGLRLDNAVAFSARHHALRAGGSVSFELGLDPTGRTGTVITLGGMKLALARGKLLLQIQKPLEDEYLDRKTNETKTRTVMRWTDVAWADFDGEQAAGWQGVELRWRDRAVEVRFGSSEVLAATLEGPVPIPPMGRGLAIRDPRARISPPMVTFGPMKGAVLDDLVMRRQEL